MPDSEGVMVSVVRRGDQLQALPSTPHHSRCDRIDYQPIARAAMIQKLIGSADKTGGYFSDSNACLRAIYNQLRLVSQGIFSDRNLTTPLSEFAWSETGFCAHYTDLS
jgi:hypothetical protein